MHWICDLKLKFMLSVVYQLVQCKVEEHCLLQTGHCRLQAWAGLCVQWPRCSACCSSSCWQLPDSWVTAGAVLHAAAGQTPDCRLQVSAPPAAGMHKPWIIPGKSQILQSFIFPFSMKFRFIDLNLDISAGNIISKALNVVLVRQINWQHDASINQWNEIMVR